MNPNIKLIGIHIAAWVVYVLILLLGTDKPDYKFWTNTVSTIIPIIILFYLNVFFLFPKFLQRKKYVPLVILLLVFNFSTICLRLLLVMLFQQSGIDNFIHGVSSPVAFWNQFRVNLLFIGISFAWWYAVRNYRSEKNQQLLQREILDARLSSLKNQINPHFLYNTLSLLYTKALSHSEELANAIAKLSDMMRYSLGVTGNDGKVSLNSEIAHMKNFIEIQQMRFQNNLNIHLETQGRIDGCRVMPLLLISFIENAFKHGELNDVDHPLKIQLHVSDHLLDFEIKNKKAGGKKERTPGIGLQNIRNRLELTYPEKHDLHIKDTEDEFIVNLKLNLV